MVSIFVSKKMSRKMYPNSHFKELMIYYNFNIPNFRFYFTKNIFRTKILAAAKAQVAELVMWWLVVSGGATRYFVVVALSSSVVYTVANQRNNFSNKYGSNFI